MSSNDLPIDHTDDAPSSRGMNRRQMIKAAGIAGAAAWTAPVILDSLSSPAAAATVAPGCYKFSWGWAHPNGSTSTCGWVETASCFPTISGASCSPTGSFNPSPPTISFTTCAYNGTNTASSTVNVAETSCKIVSIHWSNNTCSGALSAITPAQSNASGNIPSGDGDILRAVFVVQCT